MASLDVSAAFDSVSIELLMKGLTIIGHPDDVLCLIRFSNRSYYILINGRNSEVANILEFSGTPFKITLYTGCFFLFG